jgi:hypothetical protein
MVQLQEPGMFSGPMVFWKLDSGGDHPRYFLLEMLKDRRYTCKSRTKVLIQKHFVRCQRGLLSYEGLPIRELKLFIKQRGIPITAGKKPTLSSLKAQLEQADDDLTFDRFCDLPPELRQKIFQQYFDSFGQYVDSTGCHRFGRPVCAGQPPITMTSKQTRQEALPLFYSRCEFDIVPWRSGGDNLAMLDEAIARTSLVQNTDPHDFACIRFLILKLRKPRMGCDDSHADVTVNINDRECPMKVKNFKIPFTNSTTEEEKLDRLNGLLMLEPRTIFRGIAAREGLLKLQKNDIALLCGSVWRALQQVWED